MNLHFELSAKIEQTLPEALDGPIEQKQDAMIIRLTNGVMLEVRYAATDAYSLRWRHSGVEFGIDTAPIHHGLATFPNHLHDAAGRIVADPITQPGTPPEENLTRLIRTLLHDPMLGSRVAP